MIIARPSPSPKESLRNVLNILRNTSDPHVAYFVRTMRKGAKENGVKVG